MAKSLFGLFLLALVALVCAESDASDVVVLTSKTFDDQVKSGDWLLEFYAPWCGHCKKLVPAYEQLAKDLKGKVNIAKVDCTVEKDLQNRFGIKGFPTIKYYSEGKLYDFEGPRTVDNFKQYIEEGYKSSRSVPLPPPVLTSSAPPQPRTPEPAAEPKDTVILTDENFYSQIAKGDWLVKFYAPWCGHCKRLAPTFDEAATALKGTANLGKIDCTIHKSVCGDFNIRGYPTMYFISNGQMREYKSDRTVAGIKQYIQEGYRSVEATTTPTPSNAMKKQLSNVIASIEKTLQVNVWLVIGACASVGVGLGLLVVWCIPGNPPAPVPIVKRPTPVADEDDDSEPTENPNKTVTKGDKKED